MVHAGPVLRCGGIGSAGMRRIACAEWIARAGLIARVAQVGWVACAGLVAQVGWVARGACDRLDRSAAQVGLIA
ncbi:hypothetical protein [Nocardia sp. alder85J]|uniref:hypothetical protein n=1 Tax=Nocardia sp. alder85J TaxID=2862949 RepID=UPI001CD349FF|nr:hypothetical protein [Nocardia sp. alder85J]MCX4091432.1 hypothetical protein [Nocardia sp. alder85J]